MYINKKIQRMIIASVIAGGIFNLQLTNLSFIIPHSAFLIGNVAHAEIQTCTGTGDYIMPENGTPENAKEKAKLYAERNALEQAGIFISSQTVVKNAKLQQDEIQAFTAGILKVIDVKYKAIPLNEEGGYIKYTAIVTVQIDTTDLDNKINQWLSRNNQERVNQNNDLQRIIDEQARRIKELEQTIANAQTPQDTANINTEIQSIDKATLAAQRFEEGNKLYDNGDYNGAISKYTEAIQLNPKLAEAYNNRGWTYVLMGKYDEALVDLNKAIKLNPNYVEAYDSRGVAYYHMKQYNKALVDLDKAITINPNYGEVYYHRGQVYQAMGDNARAQTDFDKARELGYNG